MNQKTVQFAITALAFLLVGLVLCVVLNRGEALYSSFSTAVGMVVGAIAIKHGVDGLAQGSGVRGAWKNLTTDARPGEDDKP